MKYTDEMYLEDLKLAKFTFRNFFLKYKDLKDEFIQIMSISLFRCRDKYDAKRGKYSVYAITICRRAIFKYFQSEKTQKRIINKDAISLFAEIGEDLTIEETIGTYDEIENNLNYEYLFKDVMSIIKDIKSKLLKKVALLLINGNKCVEIGRKLNISRQCADMYIFKFRKLVYDKLQNMNPQEWYVKD